MPKKDQWVVPRDKGWAVRGEGNSKDTSHHHTQQEAINAGKAVAQNQKSELYVQNRQGQIRERNSYGKDPFPPRG